MNISGDRKNGFSLKDVNSSREMMVEVQWEAPMAQVGWRTRDQKAGFYSPITWGVSRTASLITECYLFVRCCAEEDSETELWFRSRVMEISCLCLWLVQQKVFFSPEINEHIFSKGGYGKSQKLWVCLEKEQQI